MERKNSYQLSELEGTLKVRMEDFVSQIDNYSSNERAIRQKAQDSRSRLEKESASEKARLGNAYLQRKQLITRTAENNIKALETPKSSESSELKTYKDRIAAIDRKMENLTEIRDIDLNEIHIILHTANERIKDEKRKAAKKIRDQYQSLIGNLKEANGSLAGLRREKTLPKETSIGEKALFHPFAYSPGWLTSIRRILAVASIGWILVLLYQSVSYILNGYALADLWASPLGLTALKVLAVYAVIDYVISAIYSAVSWTRGEATYKRTLSDDLKNAERAVQKAKENLQRFVAKYESNYSDGKGGLDINPLRTPIEVDRAFHIFFKVEDEFVERKVREQLVDSYPFGPNKDVLNDPRAFSSIDEAIFYEDFTDYQERLYEEKQKEYEKEKAKLQEEYKRLLVLNGQRAERAKSEESSRKEKDIRLAEVERDKAIAQSEQTYAKRLASIDIDTKNQIERLKQNMQHSVLDFYAQASQSIVTMPPYLRSASNRYETAVLAADAEPTLELIRRQASERTYMPYLLIGADTDEQKFGEKKCVIPAYISWQSMDNVMATTGNIYITYDHRSEAIQTHTLIESMICRMMMSFPAGEMRLSILDPTGSGHGAGITRKMRECEELYSKQIYTTNSEIQTHLESLVRRIRDIKGEFARNELSLVQHNHDGIKHNYELVILYDPFNSRPQYAESLKKLLTNGVSAGIYVMIVQSDYCRSEVLQEFSFESFQTLLHPHKDKIEYLQTNISWDSSSGTFNAEDIYECGYLPTHGSGELIDPIDITEENGLVDAYYHALAEEWQAATKSLTSRRWSDWTSPYSEADIECWTKGIKVPIGINADTKVEEYYRVEETSAYAHSFVQGKSGGGKSKLLCGIISSIAMKYSPAAVQMYLFDFKDGAAFKCYRGAPHMRWLVTTRADKTMFLAVLHDLEKEQARRAQLFAQAGNVGELHKYNQRMLERGGQCLPRIILVVDECHDIYTSVNARELTRKQREIDQIFEQIAKKYRSYGIHLLLASQQVPSEMTWIAQVSNNYILDVGNERSVNNLLSVEIHTQSDDIQKRIAEMPEATAVFSTAEQTYVSMLSYEDYENAGKYIRKRVEQQMGARINEFQTKEWNGELNVSYCGYPATWSMEFGVDTTGTDVIGTFIESRKQRNVLLYGIQGGERAKQLTMRTLISTLRGQIMTQKFNPNPAAWPEIYIVNSWEEDDMTTNIWQQSQTNALRDSQLVLSNLAKNGFVRLVAPQDIDDLLLDLDRRINEKRTRNTLLYIIGLNEIRALRQGERLTSSAATNATETPARVEEPARPSWKRESYQSSSPAATPKEQPYGTDVLTHILQSGIEYGIHTIIQLGSHKELEDRGIKGALFQHIIFQQAKTVTNLNGTTIELENPTDMLPIEEKNARTLYYDMTDPNAEQFVIPFMLDELVKVAEKGQSVGEYIMQHIDRK